MAESKQTRKKIYGYMFAILVRKGENGGYIACCPGVGGIYEEGRTKHEAQVNAYNGAVAILSSRMKDGCPLTQGTKYLKILREPPNIHDISKRDRDNYVATVPQIPCIA